MLDNCHNEKAQLTIVAPIMSNPTCDSRVTHFPSNSNTQVIV